MPAPDIIRAAVPPAPHIEPKGCDGHHHDHAHQHSDGITPDAPARAPRNVSLFALSSGQRLLLTIPAIASLWALAAWALGTP